MNSERFHIPRYSDKIKSPVNANAAKYETALTQIANAVRIKNDHNVNARQGCPGDGVSAYDSRLYRGLVRILYAVELFGVILLQAFVALLFP